ncbi:MAG: hypothetical protein ACUVTD_02475 [Nitrososphaerales archaeon]
MNVRAIIAEYSRIRKVFPSSLLSKTFKHFLIQNLQLPAKFSPQSTHLLIKLHPESDYLAPECYVDRKLRIYGRRSRHLDENLTEREMLDKGWVKLCMRVNWHPNLSLTDYLIMVIEYLEGLRE